MCLAVSFPKTFAAGLDLAESHKSTAKRTIQDDADLAKVCQNFSILIRIISVLSSKASIRNEVRKCAQKKICSDYHPPPRKYISNMPENVHAYNNVTCLVGQLYGVVFFNVCYVLYLWAAYRLASEKL